MKDKGFILLGMLFLMLLLAVTAVALNRRAAVQARMATNQTQATQAYLSRVAVFQHAVWKLTNDPCWRTIQMEAYTDLTFATGAGNDTITTAAGNFDADGFEQGDQIAIVYSSPDNNDGIYTILNDVSADPDTIEVPNGSLNEEGVGAATIAGLSGEMEAYNDLTFATGAGDANDTITTAAGNFDADGFAQGDQIAIVYSSPDNIGIYTILNDVSTDPDTIEVGNGTLNPGGAGFGTATVAALVLTDEEVTFNNIDYNYLALNSIVPEYRDAITVTRTKPSAGIPVNTSFRYYIYTVAGTGVSGYSGDGGLATSAELKKPQGITVDASGNIYIADTENYCIRKVDASGTITYVAGVPGQNGYSGDGGLATSAKLDIPRGVFVDGPGNIYIADANNCRIRKVDATTGIISTVAGNGNSGYSGDSGQATSAELKNPQGVTTDASGNIYIADTENYCIRKVDTTGIITTMAGIPESSGYSGDGRLATSAQLNKPQEVFVDSAGNIFIVDTANHAVRVLSVHDGTIKTVAGNGSGGYNGDNQPAVTAQLYEPGAVAMPAIRGGRKIYVSDTENNRIRVLTFKPVKEL